MSKFDVGVAAELFANTAQRGNPLLAGVDLRVLSQRGLEMARHARKNPCSFIATVEGKPVGVMFAWDGADEPELTPHPSLSVHAALHAKTMEERHKRTGVIPRGRMCHAAYGGVLPGYPAYVLLMLNQCIARGAFAAGYHTMYGVAVNPVTARGSRYAPRSWRWNISFDDVVLPNGDRPLVGVPPHRAEVICASTALFRVIALLPSFAIPYVSEFRKSRFRSAGPPAKL
eukprot:TRINITY_DN1142_c0_g2_i1.p1 TRINITY_DN1142_c0_g2~~TRINITY_DN1142_c0_g2_i1.p1  ORF type:complete len:229 (+),score=52.26 TRINITY_DN1142_c0_g2_i1:165-851(+)